MYSKNEQMALSLTQTSSSSLSFISSSAICITMLRSENKLSTAYRRIIFGMSVYDILMSLGMMFSTMATPKDTDGVWKPMGNQVTCSMQGFFVYIGTVGAPLYNFGLCIYYLCISRYGMRESVFTKKIEPYLHWVPFLYTITTAILFLARDLYHNRIGGFCFLSPYPRYCQEMPNVECERGLDYLWYFVGYHQIVCFCGIVIMMILIVCTIFRKERQSSQNQFRVNNTSHGRNEENTLRSYLKEIFNCSCFRRSHEEEEQQEGLRGCSSLFDGNLINNNQSQISPRCKEVVKMACLYVGVYFLTLVFPYAANIIRRYKKVQPHFLLLLLARIFYPLQGFFNMLVFTRPHVITLRQRHGYTRMKAQWVTIFKYGGEVPSERRRRSRRRGRFLRNDLRSRRTSRPIPVAGYESPQSPLAGRHHSDNNVVSFNLPESRILFPRSELTYNHAEAGSTSPGDEEIKQGTSNHA